MARSRTDGSQFESTSKARLNKASPVSMASGSPKAT